MIKEKNYSLFFFLISGALLTYFILIFVYQAPLLNNGDYHRITNGLISIPAYTSLSNACFPINEKLFYTPLSTTSLFFEISLVINLVLGKDCWSLNNFFLMLSVIYLLGVFIYAKQDKTNKIVLIGLILAPCFFSPFLKSLYEESVLLTLLPWLVVSVHLALTQSKLILFGIMSILLILTKIQLLLLLPGLFFLAHYLYKQYERQVIVLIIYLSIMIIVVGMAIYGKQDTAPNAYNRLFNGVGWSMQEVDQWPANQFISRLEFFSRHQNELQQSTNSTELVKDINLWGTSYWPTGLELFTSGNDPRWEKITEAISLKKFLAFFYHHPKVTWTYLRNITGIFIQSDYSISYLQDVKPNSISIGLSAVNRFCMQHLSWLYCFLLATYLYTKRNWGLVLGTPILLLAPFFVVLGDGFFEFEKHMMPFFISLPLLLILFPDSHQQQSQFIFIKHPKK
jgi:hypothetical protein